MWQECGLAVSDTNGFISRNKNGLISDDDSNNLSESQRQNNLWNKGDKTAKNHSFFNGKISIYFFALKAEF